jgi:E3 ubiquitin-protein ligase HUWE1
MGKITKTMQAKHGETQSPWLKEYVHQASSIPLANLPEHLAKFPSRWPFPRGDLYHWIPLLNRFDSVLEAFCSTYKLNEGPQSRDFGCDLLLNRSPGLEPHDDEVWTVGRLGQLGYGTDGDGQLIEALLSFTKMLLEHCGNRSIYASSSHLSDLLNTTSLSVLSATLEVGSELAQRYQASVKRIGVASRQVSSALLANHYNIDLDRVLQISNAFVKAPMISFSESSPSASGSAGKGKERAPSFGQKNVATMFANDLVAVVSAADAQWHGWGDIKISYYPPSSIDSIKVLVRCGRRKSVPNRVKLRIPTMFIWQ